MTVTSGSSVPLLDALAVALRGVSGESPRPKTERSGASGVPVVVLDEFLARPQIDDLIAWVVENEQRFAVSQVITPSGAGRLDTGHRRSKVLFDYGPLNAVFAERLMSVFGYACDRAGVGRFPVSQIEMQITASNDGEYFRAHTDNTHPLLTGRRLTYVYFFHREPAAFAGGRLRFFQTSQGRQGRLVAGPQIAEIGPRQNQVVFFPSFYYHEVETVSCPSRLFVDSRFTVNGWFRAA